MGMKGQRSGPPPGGRRANLPVRFALSLEGSRTYHINENTATKKATVFSLVGMKGLEPSRLTALVPKTSVYTNFTTSP